MPRYALHCIVVLHFACGSAWPQENELPVTGQVNSQFAAVDAWVQEFMQRRKIPGGSLAIAVDGELKFSRGYGYADQSAKSAVQPDSLFRIASVSKPMTAVAVLKLVEQDRLKLDDKIVDLLKLRPEPPADYDPWWNDITIHHLLTHTAGWDRTRSGDPMFMNQQVAQACAGKLPVQHRDVINFQLTRGIDYAPGERYSYSNFGYCLLGRAIETASGMEYEKYVQEELFRPLGITTGRIGGSLESDRAENEVHYYTIDDYQDDAVVGPDIGKHVPGQYGGWDQRLLDAHGGWIMSCPDLVKFGAALDETGDSTRGKLLKVESVRKMFASHVALSSKSTYKVPGYGYGWTISQLDDTRLVQHGGALPCTAAVLGRLGERIWFAALFNLGKTADEQWIQTGLDRELGRRILEAERNRE